MAEIVVYLALGALLTIAATALSHWLLYGKIQVERASVNHQIGALASEKIISRLENLLTVARSLSSSAQFEAPDDGNRDWVRFDYV